MVPFYAPTQGKQGGARLSRIGRLLSSWREPLPQRLIETAEAELKRIAFDEQGLFDLYAAKRFQSKTSVAGTIRCQFTAPN